MMKLFSYPKKIMTKFKAIVFDLDDTLYPEREYVLSGFRSVAKWMASRSNISENQGYSELQNLFENGIRGDTFNLWLNKHKLFSETILKELIEVYRKHTPTISPYPDALKFLEEHNELYKFGIISDGYLSVQQKKLKALNIRHYFDSVIFSDTWGRDNWKPSTRPYIEALSELQTKPETTVYVADNPTKDFFGARICGWHSLWLKLETGEYSLKTPPSADFLPDVTIRSFSELDGYLSSDMWI